MCSVGGFEGATGARRFFARALHCSVSILDHAHMEGELFGFVARLAAVHARWFVERIRQGHDQTYSLDASTVAETRDVLAESGNDLRRCT